MAIEVRKLHPLFAAELSGVDAAKPDAALVELVEDLMREHAVLCIRDQGHIDDEQHLAFARAFGPLELPGNKPHNGGNAWTRLSWVRGFERLGYAALFVEPGRVPPRDLERTLKNLKYSNVEARETVALASAAGALPWPLDLTLDGPALRRAVARTGRLELGEVDPAALLRRCADACASAPVEVEAAGAPPRWRLDAPKLERVLGNLLDNAAQAAPGKAVVARVHGDDRRLVFEVRDRGPGVVPEERARIFEPFHTTRTRGTGLGLAVTKRIVEQHGGTIEVLDAPGGGACFRVTLPPQPSA